MSSLFNAISCFFETPAQSKLKALQEKTEKTHQVYSALFETDNFIIKNYINPVHQMEKVPGHDKNPDYLELRAELNVLLDWRAPSRSQFYASKSEDKQKREVTQAYEKMLSDYVNDRSQDSLAGVKFLMRNFNLSYLNEKQRNNVVHISRKKGIANLNKTVLQRK